MKKELIQSLTKNFESHSHQTKQGVEFWFARDIQQLLGYEKWDNFLNVISKAKVACEISKHTISDHFADVGKMVFIGSGAETEVLDMILTRYACYLIAQNGDPRKEQIAFAQNYFAVQTRKFEIIEQRIKNFAIIRSKGDSALFGGQNTATMKKKLGVPKAKPLADFLPTITIKAKDFATEITVFNLKEKNLKTEKHISIEHVKNNKSVRKALLDRGIKPEELPPEEDVKKLERRMKNDDKKNLRNPGNLL